MSVFCVITTINEPTGAVLELENRFGSQLIVVGDKKTPADWNCNGVFPVNAYRPYVPENHYARKNLGYMVAIENKASVIYDTDDDNIPNFNWKIRSKNVEANESLGKGWYNVYDRLNDEYVWPRGFSLKHLNDFASCGVKVKKISSIQQGLADGDPDVDAIWRLTLKKEINFRINKSIYVQPGAWCPFNSQSTWWFPRAYALMYLPIYASFRMTDIWRSFVAQRCLWELGEGVTFHSPAEVFQDRNEHDLLKDFAEEVPGYLNNDRIVEILSALKLKQGEKYVLENLFNCYIALTNENILPYEELDSLQSWINDYEVATRNME